MSAADPITPSQVTRRHAFWWRVAFVSYALILTTTTHWPALDIGRPGEPPPDKFVHLYAFGLLTGFLWMTRWVRRPWLLLLIGLAWAGLDEWTQSLPVLRRTFSWSDLAASAAGVIVAWAWVKAMRPVGGPLNRTRARFNALLAGGMYASIGLRNGFIAWATLAAAVTLTMAGLLQFWPKVVVALPNPVPGVLYGAAQAALLGGLLWVWLTGWRRLTARARTQRTCPFCGTSCRDVFGGADGVLTCRACGGRTHGIIWHVPTPPDGPTMRRLVLPGLLRGVLLLAGIYIGAVMMYLVGRSGVLGAPGERLASELTRLPRDFTMTLDAAILLIASAVVARGYREGLARRFDEQGRVCMTCGHDLRGTPVQGGLGACGECGGAFAAAASTASHQPPAG